jgi:hypothetical protein
LKALLRKSDTAPSAAVWSCIGCWLWLSCPSLALPCPTRNGKAGCHKYAACTAGGTPHAQICSPPSSRAAKNRRMRHHHACDPPHSDEGGARVADPLADARRDGLQAVHARLAQLEGGQS